MISVSRDLHLPVGELTVFDVIMAQDYVSVHQYPPVRGMAHRLFFWSHDHPEGGASDESKSKYNDEEAKMAVRLAKHLLLQVCIPCKQPQVAHIIVVYSCIWVAGKDPS